LNSRIRCIEGPGNSVWEEVANMGKLPWKQLGLGKGKAKWAAAKRANNTSAVLTVGDAKIPEKLDTGEKA